MREDEEKKEEMTDEAAGQRETPGRELYEWTQALVGSVLTVVLVFTFLIRLIGVDGHSMVPTLQNGDRLLVLSSLLDSDYEYGDIVVLREESFLEEPIVKRVIATEGQTVVIDYTENSVSVDGERLDEPYVAEIMIQPAFSSSSVEMVTVPEGEIFVMGDNRNHSSDSRHPDLGTVDLRCVLGKAQAVLLPLSHLQTIH